MIGLKLPLPLLAALIVALGLLFARHAQAQDQPPAQDQDQSHRITVVTGLVSPLAMKQGDTLSGFSVDLWDDIAHRLGLETNFKVVGTLDDYFAALRSKEARVGNAIIYYSTDRDKEFDFSFPILDTGQQIMVRQSGLAASVTPFQDVLALLFSKSALIWLGVALVIIIVPAHVVWLFDRGNADGACPSKAYFPGIFEALTFATTALVSQVQTLPSQRFARVFGLLWMFAGVVFIALYTAQLTATLTAEQISGAINGPEDLPGKRVATIAGSLADAYLHRHKAQPIGFATPDEMYDALLEGKVDAVLFGAPALRFFAAHDGAGRVRIVGPEFSRQGIGFVFPLGDPLRRNVSSALLAMREDGTYQRVYDKWFGNEP